ncbi:M23 family metallopeptidase [Bacteroidales bacterium OttesenSCG-928-B11]|nr:M23 family metallopeptidase [Bacteroidales bacterium OttesenSCG-928-E04]MDL2312564.1 M23 family metallopeptidase [Bacteroidales bacterium OttesenSCG-928-B11]MDL2325827.1 M23 family metallopeptidase [Bacteroidales bacterium OttesenSCG-928-A14]
MNKSRLFLIIILLGVTKSNAQFNSIYPKTNENKVPTKSILQRNQGKENAERIPVIDSLEEKRKAMYNARKNVSLPIDNLHVTSPYGLREHPIDGKMKEHKGVDLRANNDYIYSVMPGKVIRLGNDKKLGKYIEIDHGDFKTIYGHLQTISVKVKQSVSAGQIIAISGNTGNSTGEHLHFGLKYNNVYIDPVPFLDYVKTLIDWVRTDLSRQIDATLKKE